MEIERQLQTQIVVPELYFLIAKFLANGPLQNVAEVLIKELEQKKILPRRSDWLGQHHEQTYTELESRYSHIGPQHLLEICSRISPILDRELPPSVAGVLSLLGAGKQSLLRSIDSIVRPKRLIDHCTRINSMPQLETSNRRPTNNIVQVLYGRQCAGPIIRRQAIPVNFYSKLELLRRTLGHLSAVYCVLFDRSGKYIITGADDLLVKLWSAIDGRLLTTFRGASAEITDIAVNLDNTLLAAGSLDRILRVWDLQTAGPIAVLLGHTGMITSVNFCPSPRGDLKYLVTTSTDGSVAFWQYNTPRGAKTYFAPKPIQYHEKLRPGQAQMICASFSPGGIFLAAGSADHHVRVYIMSDEGPKRILETEAHSDTVDSIQWAHNGLKFVSGSKDGMAHVWNFESQQWKSLKLNMSDRLPSCPQPQDESKKLKVTMVSWDFTDKWVITAVNDFTIKVWNAVTGKLHKVMRGHTDELYVLESHPKDPHIIISAGHDGQMFVWDIMAGESIASFINHIEGQGHGGVFDAKWSPDGSMIAATDSHGHILMYGFGCGHPRLKLLPKELFFHTDYRPLVRDGNHFVMDEQTQTMPHLMPPPFLVDVDGNPHPPSFQRLVPGRESCTTDELIPNLAVGPEGVEVVEAPNMISNIDRLIAVLANRQGPGQAPDSNNERENNSSSSVGPSAAGAAAASAALNRSNSESGGNNPNQRTNGSRLPQRRTGEVVEGVRQSSGNWQREQNFKWLRRVYVQPMRYSRLQGLRQTVYVTGQQEQEIYKREMRRRPMMINTSIAGSSQNRPSSNRLRQRNVRGGGGGGAAAAAAAARRTRANPPGSTGALASSSSSSATAAGSSANIASIFSGNSSSPGGGAASTNPPAYRTRAVREREHVHEDDDDDDDPDNMASASSGCDDSNDSTAAEEDLMSGSTSSDTESSDYSDWVANDQPGQALEPPKRSKRKPVRNRAYSPISTENNNRPSASTSSGGGGGGVGGAGPSHGGPSRPGPSGVTAGRNKKIPPQLIENGEIPEVFRPPEWLSEVIPRKTPYYPQMGDEVVYFRQGHQRYLDYIRAKKIYKVNQNIEPWIHLDLRDNELVKVIGIKYEIRPPRLCCLKLALINSNGSLTGQSFTIKYHDIPDVLDFLVLRQTYDMAVRRLWTPGDRFRCMIDDGWWMGLIESRTALSPEFPNSLFMCFRIRWDNGEYEFMSPWDMEPIDQNRLPADVGGAVPVLPEEIRATLYQPRPEEWPRGDRDATCRRIVAGIEHVMSLAIADPFLAPVDLNIYPTYAFVVEYPIDLTTIKARFDNHFYRRLTSPQFDVRYLATNAEKFNQSNSHIVKHARIITDLCLRIIKDQNTVDVRAVYHQLMDTYVTTDSDDEPEAGPSTSTGGPTTPSGARRSTRIRSNVDWRTKCRELLELIWQRDDSTPFREPVDLIDHPDYLASVDTPMDLRTVKEDLLGGNYQSPSDFVKDVRLIFSNSRNYNTNKRSRIYSMTLRLSNLFEAQLKTIVYNWKNPKRRQIGNKKTPVKSRGGSGGGGGGGAGPSTSNGASTSRGGGGGGPSGEQSNDSDELIVAGSRKHLRRNLPTHATNGVSSSMTNNHNTSTPNNHHHTHNGTNGSADLTSIAGPSTSSGRISRRIRSQSPSPRKKSNHHHTNNRNHRQQRVVGTDDDDDESTASSTPGGGGDSDDDTSNSDDSDDDSDEDDSDGGSGGGASLPISSLGISSRQQRTKKNRLNSDSEDSYKPNKRSVIKKKNGRKKRRRKEKVNGRAAVGATSSATTTSSSFRSARGTGNNRRTGSGGGGGGGGGSGGGGAVGINNDDDEDDDIDVDFDDDDGLDNHDDDVNDADYNVVNSRTPKKRSPGRPKRIKKHLDSSTGDEDSKQQSQQRPSTSGGNANTNTPAAASAAVASGSSGRRQQPRRYESDHSYHLNSSTASTSGGAPTAAPSTSVSGSHKRRLAMDTDSDGGGENNMYTAPTRSGRVVRKPPTMGQPPQSQQQQQQQQQRPLRHSWGSQQPNSSQGNNLGDSQSPPSHSQYTKRKHDRRKQQSSSEDHHSQEDSSNLPPTAAAAAAAATETYRPLRSTRTRISPDIQQDEDDSDDDQVLSQLTVGNSFRTRPRRNYREETDPLSTTATQQNGTTTTTSTTTITTNRRREINNRQQQQPTSSHQHNNHHHPQQSTNNSSSSSSSTGSSNHQSSSTVQQISVSETNRLNRSHVQEDHNYGEPEPLSLRHSRRTATTTLSRHQRNPDELDIPANDLTSQQQQQPHDNQNALLDPLAMPTATTSRSGRLRQRQTITAPAPPISSTSTEERYPRRHRRIEEEDEVEDEEEDAAAAADDDENNDDEEDDDVDAEEEEEESGSGGGGGGGEDVDEEEEFSDPDDDKPLRYVANKSISPKQQRRGRRPGKKRIYSDGDDDDDEDEEDDDDEEEDDDEFQMPGPSQSSTSRSTRTQKRPYYNEDSDDETLQQAKRRIVNENSTATPSRNHNNHNHHQQQQHQHQQHHVNDGDVGGSNRNNHINDQLAGGNEDFNDQYSNDDDLSDSEQPLSVSSRGRVRKITAKARGLFRE